MIPDTGAVDGLCGDHWAIQLVKCSAKAGLKATRQALSEPMVVSGVGQGSQSTSEAVTGVVGIEDSNGCGWLNEYKSPVFPTSYFPDLMGTQSLERLDALIRCRTGEIWFLGPDGVKIIPGKSAIHINMVRNRTKHWAIPVDRFQKNMKNESGIPSSHHVSTTTIVLKGSWAICSGSSSAPRWSQHNRGVQKRHA